MTDPIPSALSWRGIKFERCTDASSERLDCHLAFEFADDLISFSLYWDPEEQTEPCWWAASQLTRDVDSGDDWPVGESCPTPEAALQSAAQQLLKEIGRSSTAIVTRFGEPSVLP